MSGCPSKDFDEVGAGCLAGCTIDLASAYRQLPVRPEHQWACVVSTYCPERGCPSFLVLRALPFGAVASVEAFL
eukprot:4446023-Amphidinium_carterae.1